MKYSLLNVLGRLKGTSQKWLEVDISTISIQELVTQYYDIYIQLDHPTFEGKSRYTTLSDLHRSIDRMDLTLLNFFDELNTSSIVTHPGTIQVDTGPILSSDIWDAGFNVQLTDRTKHPDIDLPNSAKNDLLLTKSMIDYNDLYHHTLVNINGLFHRTSASEYGLHIVDGAYGMRQANRVLGSITSFEHVGSLDIIDVSEDMIYYPKPDVNLYEQTYLNLGIDTEDKTVLLVIGGYLHALDEAYSKIGNGLIKIDFNRIPLIQRHLESTDLIDQTSLGIEYSGKFNHLEVDSILRSDNYIKALLSLSQSFIVVIDTPHVIVDRTLLEASKLPGVYYSYKKPLGLLTSLRGKCLPYKSYDGQNKWVLNTEDNLKPNYVFETTDFEIQYSIASNLYPAKPYQFDKGYLTSIEKNRIVIVES